jgi:hypothetical protein
MILRIDGEGSASPGGLVLVPSDGELPDFWIRFV